MARLGFLARDSRAAALAYTKEGDTRLVRARGLAARASWAATAPARASFTRAKGRRERRFPVCLFVLSSLDSI